MATKPTKRSTKPRARTAAKPRKAAVKKSAQLQSFKLATDTPRFMSFQPTVQTLYWLIIGALVVALAAWALSLQLQILSVYNQIDSNSEAITQIKSAPHHQ